MKILFEFFVPSGGVETLNRMRSKILHEYGVESHLLYTQPGTGLQNITDVPVTVTNLDHEIKALLEQEQFDAIVTTSDYTMTERLRSLGYPGVILYEGQGFGTWQDAYVCILEASTFIKRHTQGILMPPTTHLIELFQLHCPSTPHFIFPNMIDIERFRKVTATTPENPIIAWIGRLEPNKNWREYLLICNLLRQVKPNLSFWMYMDETPADPEERLNFGQMVVELELGTHLHCLNSVANEQMPE